MADSFNSADNSSGIMEKTLQAAITEQRRARRWGIFFKLLMLGFIGVVIAMLIPREFNLPGSTEPHVAIINIIGAIEPDEVSNAHNINKSLQQAFDNKMAKAIVLRINSPGGTAVQAAYVYDEIRRLKKKSPNTKVIAVIEDMGASGAYYIASATDSIYANKASFVGSIGALINGFGFTELMKRVGVERRVYKAGADKTMLDPFLPVSAADQKIAMEMVAGVHKQFIADVKRGRGARLKNNPDLFTGRVWTGDQAKQLGLIDGFASVDGVARDIIGIEKTIEYSEGANLFERISQKVTTDMGRALVAALGFTARF